MCQRRCATTIFCLFVAVATGGCSSRRPDWFRIYDARAELAALRASPNAEVVEEEIGEANEFLTRAEQALSRKHLDEVAEVSELALLRVEYARARARKKLAEKDAETAEALLENVSQAAESQRERLRQVQSDLATLQNPEPPAPSPKPSSLSD